MTGIPPLHEVLYEFVTIGAYVKVTAVDAQTGLEVSIVGSPLAGERLLKDIARKKLVHVREKRERQKKSDGRTV